MCPFHPIRDVLYVALDEWDEFSYAPHYLHEQLEFSEKSMITKSAAITRIAVSDALFRSDVAADLADMSRVICPSSFLAFSLET